MCYTWISFLFPRIKCTPSIPLRDYFLFLSLALSLSLSNMERNPLVELICFNECLLPCWDGIKMSLRERRGWWDSAPLKCLFLSSLPYSPVVNTRDTCTQPRSNKAGWDSTRRAQGILGWCGLVVMYSNWEAIGLNITIVPLTKRLLQWDWPSNKCTINRPIQNLLKKLQIFVVLGILSFIKLYVINDFTIFKSILHNSIFFLLSREIPKDFYLWLPIIFHDCF